MAHIPQRRGVNLVLASLPSHESRRLAQAGELVTVQLKDVLHQQDRPIERVFFPSTCVISLVMRVEDRRGAEVAVVGPEGMVGLPVFLGTDVACNRAIVQVPGEALAVEAEAFRRLADGSLALRRSLHQFTNGFLSHLSASAACNCLHTVVERCCRWLLMVHKRAGDDCFPLTQHFLAEMLGVRRASVTEVARDLQRAGLVHYSRGRMTILDRPRLESASCKCFHLIDAGYDSLLPG